MHRFDPFVPFGNTLVRGCIPGLLSRPPGGGPSGPPSHAAYSPSHAWSLDADRVPYALESLFRTQQVPA